MCVCLVFLQLLDLVRAQCSATAGIVYYDTVHPMTKTPLFCAVTNAGVTQRNNKQLHECAYDIRGPCENGRTDRGVVCGVDSGLPGIHELDGAWIPLPNRDMRWRFTTRSYTSVPTTTASRAKTAEPIEVSFAVWTRVCQGSVNYMGS